MIIDVTGDYRDVANSAWISTISEVRTKSRTDEDAKRVVKFLVEHHHSSPFESVTLSLKFSRGDDLDVWNKYASSLYAKRDNSTCTIDLLNFVKITMKHDLLDKEPWLLFSEARPELSDMCSKFTKLEDKTFATEDPSEDLGNHGMAVELISLHDAGLQKLSRATWRIKCPLSIAVQILRHRTGSYNMVSGRYKTIRQELVPAVKDCAEIFDKVGEDLNRFLGSVDGVLLQYDSLMRKARESKKQDIITNDEYKRLREFARFVLPEGRMTELYVTYYLDDFYNNYLLLRNSEHAQKEHIWIAQEMQRVLRKM